MKRIGKRGLLSIAAAGSMLGLIGCEAVGGVDVNQAVADMLDVKSSEGTLSLAWEIDAESKGNAEADRLADVFGSGAIVVTELLQESQGTASMEGTIELSKGDIPFRMFVDETSMVLDVEGAIQPFELELNGFAGAGASGLLGGDMLSEALSGEAGRNAVSDIVTYVLSHVPNPERTKLGSTTATIDGQSKSLATVTTEVGVEELTELVSTAISAILEDEAGLKAFIGTLYDALKPSLTEMAKESADPILRIALNNKGLAVEFLYGQVTTALEGFAADLEAEGAFGSDLTPESGATFALLLDGAKPTGMDVGLYLEPATDAADGVGAIRIDVESRWWNVNGAVKAEPIEGTTATFPTEVKPRERLANVESGSLLYDILKNDLRMTRHSFDMTMGANASVPDGVSPYIKGAGTTMVPVRYVSEQLDAKVAWDGATSTITIKDDVDGVEIVMKVGSTSATVNGVAQSLPEAPEIIASTNSTFVPIGFITLALGGEKGWDPASGTVTITKEF